jgi:hypothetical protein
MSEIELTKAQKDTIENNWIWCNTHKLDVDGDLKEHILLHHKNEFELVDGTGDAIDLEDF